MDCKGPLAVSILNLDGTVARTFEMADCGEALRLDGLAGGMYFLKCKGRNYSIVEKILIQ